MSQKFGFRFILALVLPSAILCIIAYLLFVVDGILHLGGGETLQEIEITNQIIASIGIVICATLFFVSFRRIKQNDRAIGYGLLLPAVALSILSVTFFKKNSHRYVPFNSGVWNQSDLKPEAMAISLVKFNDLIGKSRSEIENMLGIAPTDYKQLTDTTGSVIIEVAGSWFMTILFVDGKVTETKLQKQYLSV